MTRRLSSALEYNLYGHHNIVVTFLKLILIFKGKEKGKCIRNRRKKYAGSLRVGGNAKAVIMLIYRGIHQSPQWKKVLKRENETEQNSIVIVVTHEMDRCSLQRLARSNERRVIVGWPEAERGRSGVPISLRLANL